MGDKATLAKARMELEDMYQGIPDESVNLTFQDFAELNLHRITSEKKKKPNPVLLEPISELKHTAQPSSPSPLTKLPSLDFNRALQASNHHQNHRMDHTGSYGGHVDHHLDPYQMNGHHDMPQGYHASRGGHGGRYSGFGSHENQNHQMHHGHGVSNNHHMSMASSGPACGGGGMRHGLETAAVGAYDHDISGVSGVSMASMYQQERGGGGGRRRPGIPHSNICTICSTYIYIFRHRCLCCGRVYCRQCVMVGMGEMAEGRKCVECLGKRFSQRYIQRAGKVGCWSRYPLAVKQAELKWAEKGPRRTGGSVAYGQSMMKSPRSRSPVTPMTPRTPTGAHTTSSPNSFVMSASYSPYSSQHRHHLPF